MIQRHVIDSVTMSKPDCVDTVDSSTSSEDYSSSDSGVRVTDSNDRKMGREFGLSSTSPYLGQSDIKAEPMDFDMQQEVHSTEKMKLKSPNKPIKDKTCLVCNDKALGYNFNAISCESCKAFFRRNAFKEIRGRCEGKCEVTVESRSYCKKCRLAKCFTVGMKRDLILNESQKMQRRTKIQENRMRRMGLPISAAAESSAAAGSSSDSSNGSVVIKSEPGLSASSSHIIAGDTSVDCLDGLSPHAKDMIAEVIRAFKISFDAPVEKPPIAAPTNADFLNMADASVRRLVKMAKHLERFRSLEQEDQIALLKGAAVEVLILRSARMFDTQNLGWSVNKEGKMHSVSAATFQMGNRESIAFFQQYHRFATSLLTSMHNDSVILMMMITLAVLAPDRPNVRSKEPIATAQEDYATVLQEYITLRYPRHNLTLARVLQKLADIRELNETHTKMLLKMKVDELEPLIVEIFDLNA